MSKRVVILCHRQRPLTPGALMTLLVEQWRREGFDVIEHGGDRPLPAADLAFVHVDLTVVPSSYLEAAKQIPLVINSKVRDVSKRVISHHLVTRDDAYQGAVVVKTDLNHRGLPDLLVRLRRGEARAWLSLAGQAVLPEAWKPRPLGRNYRVYERKEQVPAWVWRRPDLVVERLHTEKRNGLYHINWWIFCGDRGVVNTAVGEHPMVFGPALKAHLPPHDRVPAEVRQRRQELGLDYGKIDFVVTEEGPVVFDVTRTPGTPVVPVTDQWRGLATHIAPGIQSLMKGMAPNGHDPRLSGKIL